MDFSDRTAQQVREELGEVDNKLFYNTAIPCHPEDPVSCLETDGNRDRVLVVFSLSRLLFQLPSLIRPVGIPSSCVLVNT